jgi:hypothetical protein
MYTEINVRRILYNIHPAYHFQLEYMIFCDKKPSNLRSIKRYGLK